MGKRKRPSNTDVGSKPKKDRSQDDDDEKTTSDSDTDWGRKEAGDNKHRRNRSTRSSKGNTNKKNGATQNDEDSDESEYKDDDESESDDEFLVNIAKRSNSDKKEVEAIISNKSFNGKMKYYIKWKDGSETCETMKKTAKICPDLLREFNEKAMKALEVEAVVARKKKNSSVHYLIKWKDHTKGETWETEFRAKQLCPELVTLHNQEVEMAKRKELEVEAIVGHKIEHRRHHYLIKWKDHSKGETWESARRTIAVCRDILDEFTKDRPEVTPPASYFEQIRWWKEYTEKPKKRRNLFDPKKLSDEEDDSDENTEWEVARIVKHRTKKNESREFLIRWKGYTSEDDTWEAEENLNCPELIREYLIEVEDAKYTTQKPVKKKADRRRSKKLTPGKGKTAGRSSKRFDENPRPVYADTDDE